tara:strand:+ start:64 stop:297 length:234 start_codon:yes stop_codon:yes gene_type:complete
MTIKIKNKTTKKINKNTITTYILLINNKYKLAISKVYNNNKFIHYTINDDDHNILLNNNIIKSDKLFFNQITKLITN